MAKSTRNTIAKFALAALLVPSVAQALEPQQSAPVVRAFHHADLNIQTTYREVGQLSASALSQTRDRLFRLGAPAASARIDQLSGRFSTLLPSVPLIPGKGVGNKLSWADLHVAPRDYAEREQVALHAFLDYLKDHQADLGIDLREIDPEHRIASHGDEIYQIHLNRMVGGVPVRDSGISAVINNGNLIMMTIHQWGDLQPSSPRPRLTRADSLDAVNAYIHPLRGQFTGTPEAVYLTTADKKSYHHPLVWAVKGQIQGDSIGNWEALVDANTGEVLAFEDTNHYGDATGGVFPVTNDGKAPDGVEQLNWPMPYLTITGGTSDSGGNFTQTGNLTSSLSGPYVRMSDTCGSISLTQSNNIRYGASAGKDCTTPGVGGAGNTHASRTGFYEINRIKESARGQLPTNAWLGRQLTSNMNITSTCNAFWNGSTINFYRSGGGCANTGEISAVFTHEWGHGMDANDVAGGIASPSGEGIADVYSSLRLNTSCIGRNFRTVVCSGNGDPCTTCTGVRDIDYLKRKTGKPHTYTWSNSNCGGQVHCTGGTYAEAVWSLWKRKLTATPFNMSNNTATEVATRLTYIGAGATRSWYSGGPPNGGCAASSGYLNYLAADDDNGNLNDGTPHMTAIYGAFNDQQIACATPTVRNAGCTTVPTAAPTVTVTAGTKSASLSWTAVPNATKYQVFRTDGVFACDFGKVKLGETTGTTFSSPNLATGRDYSYVVIPIGTSNTCMGPASACKTVKPL